MSSDWNYLLRQTLAHYHPEWFDIEPPDYPPHIIPMSKGFLPAYSPGWGRIDLPPKTDARKALWRLHWNNTKLSAREMVDLLELAE